eukprot:377256_1
MTLTTCNSNNTIISTYNMNKNVPERTPNMLSQKSEQSQDTANDDEEKRHEPTQTVTTFATYNEEEDYKERINPLHNLNPLRAKIMNKKLAKITISSSISPKVSSSKKK